MKVLRLLAFVVLGLPFWAGFTSAQEAGFLAVANGCMLEDRGPCLSNVQNVLVALRADVVQDQLDESLGRLALALVNALEESFSDELYVPLPLLCG